MAYKAQYSPAFLLNAQRSKWIPFEEVEAASAAGEFTFQESPAQKTNRFLDFYVLEVKPNVLIPLSRLFHALNPAFQQEICQFITHVKGIPYVIKAY